MRMPRFSARVEHVVVERPDAGDSSGQRDLGMVPVVMATEPRASPSASRRKPMIASRPLKLAARAVTDGRIGGEERRQIVELLAVAASSGFQPLERFDVFERRDAAGEVGGTGYLQQLRCGGCAGCACAPPTCAPAHSRTTGHLIRGSTSRSNSFRLSQLSAGGMPPISGWRMMRPVSSGAATGAFVGEQHDVGAALLEAIVLERRAVHVHLRALIGVLPRAARWWHHRRRAARCAASRVASSDVHEAGAVRHADEAAAEAEPLAFAV